MCVCIFVSEILKASEDITSSLALGVIRCHTLFHAITRYYCMFAYQTTVEYCATPPGVTLCHCDSLPIEFLAAVSFA